MECKKILQFIKDKLSSEYSFWGKLIDLANTCGLNPDNLSKLKEFDPIENPLNKVSFKIVYKVLWGILQRNPIELEPYKPFITILGQNLKLPDTLRKDDYVAIPLLNGRIAAGSGRIIQQNINSFIWLYRPEIGERTHLIAVRLDKDAISMEPTLHPNDIIIIDYKDKELNLHNLYALRKPIGDNIECVVKRVKVYEGKVWLISDNAVFYPEPSIYDNLDDLIIGRVILSFTNWLKK